MKDIAKVDYLKYCMFYFVLYASLGTINPYINVYFESLGFTGSEIGTVTSISGFIGLFFAPLCGYMCDKTGKRKLVFGILIALTCVDLVIFTRQSDLFLVAIFFILFATFKVDFNSLADAIAISFCNKYKKNYSTVRMMGSFGYIFGSSVIAYIMGKLMNIDGPYFTICLGLYIILLILLATLPKVIENRDVEKVKTKVKGNVSGLLKNKEFLFIVVISALTTAVSDSYGNYLGNHIVYTLNADNSYIGINTILMVAPEIALVALAPVIFKKLHHKNTYILCFITQIIRLLIYSFTTNIIFFLIASLLHGFMVIISCVGNVNYISRVVNEDVIASAFSIYGAVYGVIGSIYAKLFGSMYTYFGTKSVFLLCSALFLIAVFIVIRTKYINILDEEQ